MNTRERALPTSMKEIGERLKSRREYLGMTQQEVAEALSMSRGNYTRIEGGFITMSAPDLAVAADFLRVPISYLYGDPTAYDVQDDEFIRFYAGQAPETKRRIMRSTRAWFDQQDAEDDKGTIGKKAE